MYHGIINIYKEPGYTSHDVVARLRGILKQKKIGHTGTLDPAAEGVLPVCLGNGTRLCELLTEKTKTYEAVLLLGRETDTQDTTGTTLREDEAGAMAVTVEMLEQTVNSFLGSYNQVPPMYSALKVGGKKLYELAREGKEIERQARPVEILEISLEGYEPPRARIRVTCSKGTYIRTLCYDIGQALGCGGCMEHLFRSRVERFRAEDSLKLDRVEKLVQEGDISPYILTVEEVLADCEPVCTRPEADNLIYNGNPCFRRHLAEPPQAEEGQLFRMYDSKGHFTGLYEYRGDRHWWKPRKMFLDSEEKRT